NTDRAARVPQTLNRAQPATLSGKRVVPMTDSMPSKRRTPPRSLGPGMRSTSSKGIPPRMLGHIVPLQAAARHDPFGLSRLFCSAWRTETSAPPLKDKLHRELNDARVARVQTV